VDGRLPKKVISYAPSIRSVDFALVFGKRAGEFAAKFSKENSLGQIDEQAIAKSANDALQPFERGEGENPYSVQHDLQETMQDKVGIVRREEEMISALEDLKVFGDRANRVGVSGNREFNPGWHTALDLQPLLAVSEAITRAAIERKESRGAQFREDFPNKDPKFGTVNTIIWRGEDGEMKVRLDPIPQMPEELNQIIEENR